MGSGEDSNSFRWFLEEVNRVRMFMSISILFFRSGALSIGIQLYLWEKLVDGRYYFGRFHQRGMSLGNSDRTETVQQHLLCNLNGFTLHTVVTTT